ncbi:MAG: hypothetical protein MZU97_13100 [Bacillus subtilis]|nr:hypothetical protein [Bacillus subtilis]
MIAIQSFNKSTGLIYQFNGFTFEHWKNVLTFDLDFEPDQGDHDDACSSPCSPPASRPSSALSSAIGIHSAAAEEAAGHGVSEPGPDPERRHHHRHLADGSSSRSSPTLIPDVLGLPAH